VRESKQGGDKGGLHQRNLKGGIIILEETLTKKTSDGAGQQRWRGKGRRRRENGTQEGQGRPSRVYRKKKGLIMRERAKKTQTATSKGKKHDQYTGRGQSWEGIEGGGKKWGELLIAGMGVFIRGRDHEIAVT